MRTIEWKDGVVVTIDQTKLPIKEEYVRIKTCEEMVDAIKTMRIRGAPVLGVAAAYGLALTAFHSRAETREDLLVEIESCAQSLRKTRPTAVNLFWAIERVLKKMKKVRGNLQDITKALVEEAQRMADEDVETNREIGENGARLIEDGDTILTHCNAGCLATVDYGTALAVIRVAFEQGKHIRVFATETRPLLQGARLTAFELKRDKIPVTLLTDNMIGYVMSKKLVSKVIVGADRIVKDAVINKIGTFTVAVVAYEHDIPFYVAAPRSTFDLTRFSRDVIIEERSPEEVIFYGKQRIAPRGINVLNPAFDITPLKYVSGIICETGILSSAEFKKLAA
ncbi:MAG TPA: S-methyl-5-thioribose-1-phosphate isomerase [Candidatus Bathyarchaeia archaeon]|nr:S-methyl-5-thioribose-1-phosphate isomerase [Candidatus Bathyarchaeia archaeon]